jgi:membrane associated rhomboid family serine protease
MFLPLRHDNMEGRRWPVVTIALVFINLLVFLATHGRVEEQGPQQSEVRAHVLLLAAMHPELAMPPEVQDFATTFKEKNPGTWSEAQSQNRDIVDAWDARIRVIEDTAILQREMDSLAEQFSSLRQNSITEQYGFVAAHPKAISYVTANFLHAGWLHLIGNMWFLWLAGAILEDTWGRIIYPIFYPLAGIAALVFHAWFNPGSLIPAIGASGAVAALMGAFLVRFPTAKIEVAVVLGLRSIANLAMGKGMRFKAASYWLLPPWLLMEVFSGTLFGRSSGVAHWAHVGGFAFGAAAALGLRYSGLEKHADAAIEAKVSWTADPAIVEATDLMEHGKLDAAIPILKNYLAAKPDSIDGYSLLQKIYWRKNDIPAHRDMSIKLCQLCLKARDSESVWREFEEFTNLGGEVLPAFTWLEICRLAEEQENYERALTEYERLAKAHPTEKQSLLALMAAGRLSLKKLNRPSDAVNFYKAAAASTVPHGEWESNIQKGIQESEKVLSPATAVPTP